MVNSVSLVATAYITTYDRTTKAMSRTLQSFTLRHDPARGWTFFDTGKGHKTPAGAIYRAKRSGFTITEVPVEEVR